MPPGRRSETPLRPRLARARSRSWSSSDADRPLDRRVVARAVAHLHDDAIGPTVGVTVTEARPVTGAFAVTERDEHGRRLDPGGLAPAPVGDPHGDAAAA